jgi:predicted ATPase
MTISSDARALLRDVLEHLYRPESAAFPAVQAFRLRHEPQRRLIDELISSGHLKVVMGRYALTIKGLLACGTAEAKREVEACNTLLPWLQGAYREQPGKTWSVDELAQRSGRRSAEVAKNLTFLNELPIFAWSDRDQVTGLVNNVFFDESVLDAEPIGWIDEEATPGGDAAEPKHPRIKSIEISGYRPFDGFSATPDSLTVIIGANASGKSSLFDFLRFASFAASNPLPPEIDPRSVGKTLFHVGGPERIAFALVVEDGQRKPLRYEVEIQGPVGTPKIVRERLATTEPLSDGEREPFIFLDFRGGKGVVRDQVEHKLKRPAWTVQPNELALRRALDPTLVTLSRFQGFLSSWRFYSGFDVSDRAAMRRPVPTEPTPTLAEDGSNLSAVLFSLMTEHVDAWQELETHLRSAIPGFMSLNVKARGGPGTVIGIWREEGVKDELTLADLSDGTLRLLCWATLCLAPSIPPLVCIDEPELGLHPRVLPTLAGLLRMASARSQILIATHSPYFLAQFDLDEIAVMRKDGGRAQFVRPGTSEALRREVEEFGGEALAQLHISDELEVRP